MKIKKLLIVIFLLFILYFFIGCIEDSTSKSIEEQIIGNWYREEISENLTYKFEYKFYLNDSFFSGVWRDDIGRYTSGIWGTYSISEDKLTLSTSGEIEGSSNHKIIFNEDGNSFKFYRQDESGYEILLKEN